MKKLFTPSKKFILCIAGLIICLAFIAGYIQPTVRQTPKSGKETIPISNLDGVCPTCQDEYTESVYFVACNTGKLYPLNLYPYLGEGQATLTAAYDKPSESRLDIFQDYYYGTSASIYQKRNMVSVPRIKAIFCNECALKILSAIDGQYITSFVLFLPREQAFYPINEGLEFQVGDYTLSIDYNAEHENMQIKYCK